MESQNNKSSGCQVNLDEGQCGSITGRIIDDIRNACSELDVSFEIDHRCYFTGDSQCYFTYRGSNWIPASYKENVTQNNTYRYEIQAYPQYYFDFIKKTSKDTKSFATSIGAEATESFENIEIIAPLKNNHAVNLINEYRSQFFQRAYKQKDMSSSVLLYLHGSELLSITLGKWMNRNAQSLQTTSYQSQTSIISFFNDEPHNTLLCYRRGARWGSGDYLQRMFGDIFEISGTSGFVFLERYTLSLNGSNEFNDDKIYMCIRSTEEIGKPDGFSSTFAEIKYVGK